MNASTAEIIDLAAYRGRRAQPAPGDCPPPPAADAQAALSVMMVPVFFVWPMPWFQIPITDDA